jgi:hypothetical protein
VRRRWLLRRRLILFLPQLAGLFVVVAIVLGTSLQLANDHGSQLAGGSQATTGSAAQEAVYTVGQIRANLLADPSSWVGHTVLVQGVLQGPFVFCGEANPCPPATLGLVDDGNGIIGSDQYLPVLQGPTATVDHLRFNVPMTYRLELRAAPLACALNPTILCYQGIITDVAAS